MFYCTDTSFVRRFVSSLETEQRIKYTLIHTFKPKWKNAGNSSEMQTCCSTPEHVCRVCVFFGVYGEIYTLCDSNNSNILQLLHRISAKIFTPFSRVDCQLELFGVRAKICSPMQHNLNAFTFSLSLCIWMRVSENANQQPFILQLVTANNNTTTKT